jgi:glucuronyl/N-acetylglucosaminyl transferase EXT1
MTSCFELSSKCTYERFKLYIHEQPKLVISDSFKNIISVLKFSSFVTNDPNEACLNVLAVDTIDRDELSKDYLQNLSLVLDELSYWSNGRNFLVFNLYTGTWPDYKEPFDVYLGQAILAKASFTYDYYRTDFDVSLPLFYSTLTLKSSLNWSKHEEDLLNKKRKYLLTFKGKRYLHGAGSQTRNSLYHLNNNRDVLMLTSCKHGTNWMKYNRDERCDQDNALYDKYELFNQGFNWSSSNSMVIRVKIRLR